MQPMRCSGPTLVVLLAAVAVAETPLRREADARFAVDAAFQDKGGVQYFYALLEAGSPATKDATFALFQPLDLPGVWSRLEAPTHVVLSRLVYTVDKDVSFFSEARVRDPRYINGVAKGMNVARRTDGSFTVAATPSNTFTIEYFDAGRVAQAAQVPALQRVLELTGAAAPPAAVVFQHNRDFARVFGMRTAEAGFTWTAHFPLGPGRTRLVVFTMSYLHTLPPFFLGGPRRVFRESTDGARTLIDNLRAYQPPQD